MRSKTTIEIHAYWTGLRGRRDVPFRSEIEPADIRAILADLFILEKSLEQGFRFRLAGTRICALFGAELRGRAFETLFSERQAARVAGIVDDVLAHRTPAVLSADAHPADAVKTEAHPAERLPVEIVLLPLRSPDGAVDRVIGAVAPLGKPHWMGAAPVGELDLTGIRILDLETPAVDLDGKTAEAPFPATRRKPEAGVAGVARRMPHLSVVEGGRRD